MTRAVSDFLTLGLDCDAVCYLGDSVEGHDLGFVQEMTEMQCSELAKVNAPIYYVVGNHDFDYFRAHQQELGCMCIPFYDRVSTLPNWHVAPSLQDMVFSADFKAFALVFLPDHAACDGSWYTTHGMVRGDESLYPYTEADYRRIADWIAGLGKPVFTLSHYAYPGGNREAPLFQRYLPLPHNIFLHFYGHAHIGDHQWAGKDCYRKLAAVDNQAIVQVNVASLENYRGNAVRSAFLEYYENGSVGVLFRNHTLARWDDCYFSEPRASRED